MKKVINQYIVKHIHSHKGTFNGTLVFLIDGKLLAIYFGTPHYNDYGEWRLSGWKLATEPYNPEDNEVELKPLNIHDFVLGQEEYDLLVEGTKLNSDECDDQTINNFNTKYPDANFELAAGTYEGDDCLTFFVDTQDDDGSNFERKEVKYNQWVELQESEKTPFENIFYPILNRLANIYYK